MAMASLYLTAAVLLQIECTVRFFFRNARRVGITALRLAAYVLLSLLPLAAFQVEQYFLPAFYLLYLLRCLLQEKVIPLSKGLVDRDIRARFVVFCSIHLSILGLLALLTKLSLGQVLKGPQWVLLGAIIALVAFILMNLYPVFNGEKTGIALREGQKKEFQYLFYFFDLGVCYIFEQSLLCLHAQAQNLYLAFFLCGNAISVVLLTVYFQALYRIRDIAGKERSNQALERSLQQGNQQIRNLLASIHFDELTGVRSRLFLIQESTRLLDSEIPFALVYIDLNGWKKINDTFGHLAGDQYLRDFAEMVQEQVRKEDTVARFGGDEFVLLLLWCSRENAEKRIEVIQDRVQNELKRFYFAAGCADTTETRQLNELIALADQRMYQQKEEGRAQRRA